MRTFVIRARSGSTRWEELRARIGAKSHIEIVAHCLMNAFYISNGFRDDVEVYIILDSSEDFPRTIQISNGISFSGFHEEALIEILECALKDSTNLQKNESRKLATGLEIHGFGFEKCVGKLLETRPVYLLDKKGDDLREIEIEADPVFVLSDHIAMPKNSVKGLIRKGMKTISLGRKMLFASQCIVLIHDQLDR